LSSTLKALKLAVKLVQLAQSEIENTAVPSTAAMGSIGRQQILAVLSQCALLGIWYCRW